jgi:hypothetical protein
MKRKVRNIAVFIILVAPLLSLCKYSYSVPAKADPKEMEFITRNYWRIQGSDTLLKGFGTVDSCRLSFEMDYFEAGRTKGVFFIEQIISHARKSAQYSLMKYSVSGNSGFDYLLSLFSADTSLNMLNSKYFLKVENSDVLTVKKSNGRVLFYLEKQGLK